MENLDFQEMMFEYVEQIKDLLSPQIWKNVLLDCTKNEILTIWLLFRKTDVNMSMIAEYIDVPLNTATGIVARLEKKGYVLRTRCVEDKRVVTICLAEKGKKLLQDIIGEITYYGTKVMDSISQDELQTVFKLLEQIKKVLSEEKQKEVKKVKVRKITIE